MKPQPSTLVSLIVTFSTRNASSIRELSRTTLNADLQDLQDLLQAKQTLVSRHLRVLREAGLVLTAPCGRFTYHRLSSPPSSSAPPSALPWSSPCARAPGPPPPEPQAITYHIGKAPPHG